MDTDNPVHETLTALTAEIVAAHVSHNSVSVDQLAELIQGVFAALSGLATPVEEAAPVLTPAVSIRASVKPDHVTCLECGKQMSLLKRHLRSEHTLTPGEYRARWDLSPDHPLIAPNYSGRRSDIAKQSGLGSRQEAQREADPPQLAPSPTPPRGKLSLRFSGTGPVVDAAA